MRCVHAKQVVPAIIGGTQHRAVLISEQALNGLSISVPWHCRAVGVDKANCTKTCGEQIFSSVLQPFSKTFATLRDQGNVVWNNPGEVRFLSDGSI